MEKYLLTATYSDKTEYSIITVNELKRLKRFMVVRDGRNRKGTLKFNSAFEECGSLYYTFDYEGYGEVDVTWENIKNVQKDFLIKHFPTIY
jgi:hypothetical protein